MVIANDLEYVRSLADESDFDRLDPFGDHELATLLLLELKSDVVLFFIESDMLTIFKVEREVKSANENDASVIFALVSTDSVIDGEG